MPEIVVVGSLKAKPGKEDETRDALGGLVAPTHAEDGCILYALHQGTEDLTRFAFVERWESAEKLQAHLGSDHIGRRAAARRASCSPSRRTSSPTRRWRRARSPRGSLAAHAA